MIAFRSATEAVRPILLALRKGGPRDREASGGTEPVRPTAPLEVRHGVDALAAGGAGTSLLALKSFMSQGAGVLENPLALQDANAGRPAGFDYQRKERPAEHKVRRAHEDSGQRPNAGRAALVGAALVDSRRGLLLLEEEHRHHAGLPTLAGDPLGLRRELGEGLGDGEAQPVRGLDGHPGARASALDGLAGVVDRRGVGLAAVVGEDGLAGEDVECGGQVGVCHAFRIVPGENRVNRKDRQDSAHFSPKVLPRERASSGGKFCALLSLSDKVKPQAVSSPWRPA